MRLVPLTVNTVGLRPTGHSLHPPQSRGLRVEGGAVSWCSGLEDDVAQLAAPARRVALVRVPSTTLGQFGHRDDQLDNHHHVVVLVW